MKVLTIVAIAVVALVTADFALAADRVRVRGYFRKDGTYVQPQYRTAPDGRFYDNWSTYGNLNPYTGEFGQEAVSQLGETAGFGAVIQPARDTATAARYPLANSDKSKHNGRERSAEGASC
jgi:hypothetical protein